ncbi:NADH-quinone oxidoreductase subunit A [Stigmatella aurantiaca]|uniref:NADH-quinone oxidoreductase subunit A n=1 Tax=Stigmatella aurantiaca (strain DW4/3-1) TaxID=378806 RepID=Q08SQ2_STIAD|nr:NADH-quinone oxidoreductase subunit A [Stigmatella aurantiaca]ADO71276.1 NADH-quinone oxidoreductase subunit [Stigmatella aurantiaca DW4/3-1]EAU63505.1 NADH-quinone oxidoreductase chain a 1 [Stigmatella aurantiaca DW4/3-1]
MSSPLAPYLPMAVALLVAGVLALLMPGLASLLGPRRPSAIKSSTFEAGSESTGPARQRFAVKFYVIALLFIIFDVEAVFLYPWAVNFQALGWFGYWEMVVFAATLVVGLIYIWKKGALDWES